MRLILLAFLTATAAAQTCTPNATQQAAGQALALQQKLLAAPSPQMDTDVPAPIKPLLHDFKQALLRTVDTALLCNNPDPAQLQSGLAALLHANKPEKPFVPMPSGTKDDFDKPEIGDYGDELMIAAKPILGQPSLYSVQLTSSIACGSDNMLLLYRRTPQGYRRELAWYNPDLNSIGDAFGDLYEWSLVPGPGGKALFAGVHGTPWCTSGWSAFKVNLIAPATDGQPQRLLADLTHSYNRASDDVATLFKTTADGFQFRAAHNSRDIDLFTRPRVYRFRTTEGTLTRVQPLADNARDFVEAWIDLPWDMSKQWASGPSPQLHSFRDAYDYELHKENARDVSWGRVLACGNNRYQVEMDSNPNSKTPQPTYYVQVSRTPAAFMVLSAGTSADPACHGPDLMPKKK